MDTLVIIGILSFCPGFENLPEIATGYFVERKETLEFYCPHIELGGEAERLDEFNFSFHSHHKFSIAEDGHCVRYIDKKTGCAVQFGVK